MSLRLITSESVTEGHPDKIADQISDGIVDEILRQDPYGRVACETLVTTGLAMVCGEITTGARLDVPGVVRDIIKKIGYTDANYGIDGDTCAVITTLDQQAAEIAVGVDGGGAGDQGMMFGYASDETEELMPAPILLAHRITGRLAEGRKSGDLAWARPDGKAQVTMEYEGDRPVRVHTVVVAAQHHPDATPAQVQDDVIQKVLVPVLPAEWFDPDNCVFHINPAGTFVTGGPHGDTGLTGRKIIVDTYGGMGHHGGGCFSGKDTTKVDRSGAYAARWAAKNVIAAGAARRCEIQIAYAIGVAEPVSIHVDTFGTGVVPNGSIADAVRKLFDFTPGGIIERLHLRDPIFLPTAAYGHFGRTSVRVPRSDTDGEEITLFPWEVTDRMEEIKEALEL